MEEWYFESRTETGDDFEYWYLNTSGTHTMFIESVDLTDNEWLSLVEVSEYTLIGICHLLEMGY